MSDTATEVYRAHREAQNRYVYFLLAATWAAIGFAVNQTMNKTLAWSQIPLAGAVFGWGLSFVFGIRHLQYVSSSLYANLELLEVESGQHSQVGTHLGKIAAASEGIREAIESNSNRANHLAHLQFTFLVAGAVLYVAWHVLEMYLRTVSTRQLLP
ncbi:MAG TPA: hypothetical protein VK201_11860 [bacterium]|nr:hypothetical protein [bacterium]